MSSALKMHIKKVIRKWTFCWNFEQSVRAAAFKNDFGMVQKQPNTLIIIASLACIFSALLMKKVGHFYQHYCTISLKNSRVLFGKS